MADEAPAREPREPGGRVDRKMLKGVLQQQLHRREGYFRNLNSLRDSWGLCRCL